MKLIKQIMLSVIFISYSFGTAMATGKTSPAEIESIKSERAKQTQEMLSKKHDVLEITPKQEPLWNDYAKSYSKYNENTFDFYITQKKLHESSAIEKMGVLVDLDVIEARDKKDIFEKFKLLYESLDEKQKKIAEQFMH